MSDTCYYLAYGSNLHPLRLNERIPSSEFLTVVELQCYSLQFHKHCTHDDSGKCNLLFTGNTEDTALAAVFKMDIVHRPILDRFEGIGYEITSSILGVAGKEREVFWYQAKDDFIDDSLKPYNWYQQIVLMGAEYHQFPKSYTQSLQSIATLEDPDKNRHQDRFDLIERMQRYSDE